MKVTDKELRMLTAIRTGLRGRALASFTSEGGWESVPSMQERKVIEADQSAQGLHQTAASLVRKGLVEKRHNARLGRVQYKITKAGVALLAGLAGGGR